MVAKSLIYCSSIYQIRKLSLLVEGNSGVVCRHQPPDVLAPAPIFINQTSRCCCRGAGGSRERGKKKSYNPIWRPCALVTLLHCACALWFCQQSRSRWRHAGQPAAQQEQGNSPRLSPPTDKLLQSWLGDTKKALGLSLNGTGRIHGRQFPVGSWYHSEPVLSSPMLFANFIQRHFHPLINQ